MPNRTIIASVAGTLPAVGRQYESRGPGLQCPVPPGSSLHKASVITLRFSDNPHVSGDLLFDGPERSLQPAAGPEGTKCGRTAAARQSRLRLAGPVLQRRSPEKTPAITAGIPGKRWSLAPAVMMPVRRPATRHASAEAGLARSVRVKRAFSPCPGSAAGGLRYPGAGTRGTRRPWLRRRRPAGARWPGGSAGCRRRPRDRSSRRG